MYQFTRETIDVYSCGVYNGMLDLDPFTKGLSKSLHKAAANAFTHTTGDAPKLDRTMQNSLYDEEGHDTRRCSRK